jgi:hypothetical protein
MHDFHYAGNRLFCEGVSVESLARKFGTPLYIYSQRTLTEHFHKLDAALAPVAHLVCFSVKSNSNLSVLRVRQSRRRLRHRQRRRIAARHRGGRRPAPVRFCRRRQNGKRN